MPGSVAPLPRSPSLLIVDDDVGFVHAAAEIARTQGFEITIAGELGQAMHRVRQRDVDVALVDLELPDGNGMSLLQDDDDPRTRSIVVTGRPTVESALESMRKNAVVDYLIKPIALDRLREVFESCANQHRATPPRSPESWHDMVGTSGAFQSTRRMIEKVAPSDASVLVHGESEIGRASCRERVL